MSQDYRMRACGKCGEKNIPYGVDWPVWSKGRPICPMCQLDFSQGIKKLWERIDADVLEEARK